MARDSRARASASSRPPSDSRGRPSSARVVVGSRSAKIITTASAAKRRATNPSATNDGRRSTERRLPGTGAGRFAAVAASRLRTATATRNLSGASPDEMPEATRSASCWGCGSSSSASNNGAHKRWIPESGSSISAWTPVDLDDPQARRLPRDVTQQRGLSDARLATDHQDRALAVARPDERLIEAMALACSAKEPHPPIRRHRRTLGRASRLQPSICRRHPSRTGSAARRRNPLDRDAALAQLRCDLRRDRFSRGGADDRASPTDMPRRVLAEQRGTVRRRVDDDVDAPEFRDRLGEQPLDVEIVGQVGANGDRGPPAAMISATVASALRLMVEVDDDDGPRPACQLACDSPAGREGAARDDRHDTASVRPETHDVAFVHPVLLAVLAVSRSRFSRRTAPAETRAQRG